MSELDLALNKFGADLAIHLLGDIDDFGCLGCQEIVKKNKLAILEVVREAIDQCLTYNDSDTHIIADDLKKELGI